MTIPHCRPASWQDDLPQARFAAHIHAGIPVGCQIGLIGLPDDTGVQLNGGRKGASKGPAALRGALARYGVFEPAEWEYPKVFDAGDVEPAGGRTEASLLETHQRVFEAVWAMLDLGLFPVAIGGGHDLTLPVVRAVAGRNAPMGGVYFDAHLDVRTEVGSGMAFRKLVEECRVRELNVFGLSGYVNAKEHLEWFRGHGGRVHESVESLGSCLGDGADGRAVFASFDMDVIDASSAPGVSAMNPAGWRVEDALHAVEMCGASPAVRCFDIMELNPEVDEGGRTARVAAAVLLAFLKGFAKRTPSARRE